MHRGKVVSWTFTSGFIANDKGGPDMFVHFSGITGDKFRKLEIGQRVAYEVEQGPKGLPQACKVRVIDNEEVNGNVA